MAEVDQVGELSRRWELFRGPVGGVRADVRIAGGWFVAASSVAVHAFADPEYPKRGYPQRESHCDLIETNLQS